MSETKVLRLKAVMEMTGMSRSTIYLYIEKGMFPKPIKLGQRAVGWPLVEVTDWIQSRQNAR
jgi:prophage regulatory protein